MEHVSNDVVFYYLASFSVVVFKDCSYICV